MSRRILSVMWLMLFAASAGWPQQAAAQVRPDTVGPGVSWQLQPRGEAGLIRGVLFTAEGEPLLGARIRVSGVDGWVESDASGSFTVRTEQVGKLDVRIERLGFHTVRESVLLPAGRSLFLTAVLREAVIHISPDGDPPKPSGGRLDDNA